MTAVLLRGPVDPIGRESIRSGSIAYMTDEINLALADPAVQRFVQEEAARLAHKSTHDLNVVLSKLLVDAVDQVRDDAATFRHDESTTYMQDLAKQAVDVPYVTPEAAIFGLARMSAAVITELAARLNADPHKLMEEYSSKLEAAQRPDGRS